MEAIVVNQPFNATQLCLLQTFSHIKSEESLEELKTVLFDFYRKKLDEETDKWWEENNMSVEKFDEMCSNISRNRRLQQENCRR
jgi:hypothetical protein